MWVEVDVVDPESVGLEDTGTRGHNNDPPAVVLGCARSKPLAAYFAARVLREQKLRRTVHAQPTHLADLRAILTGGGLRVDAVSDEFNERTALMIAAGKSCLESMRVLLDAGANTNVRNKKDGSTALMIATEQGCLQTVELLLDRGARKDIWDRKGKTVLERTIDPLFRDLILAHAKLTELQTRHRAETAELQNRQHHQRASLSSPTSPSYTPSSPSLASPSSSSSVSPYISSDRIRHIHIPRQLQDLVNSAPGQQIPLQQLRDLANAIVTGPRGISR